MRSATAPIKTDLNGKVLARLRSTAGTALLPQSGLARSSSSLSGEFQLGGSISPVPSIGRLGSIAAGPPQLNKLAGGVGLGAARRSADLPLQQLMGVQTPGKHNSQHSSFTSLSSFKSHATLALSTRSKHTASPKYPMNELYGVRKEGKACMPWYIHTASQVHPATPLQHAQLHH